jgi:hypothetical protein
MPLTHRRARRERGAALVLAILVLSILTVIGIALMLITSTESRIAANEWSMNRAFYASDAGIRWASVGMLNHPSFLQRPEFAAGPFGTVLFQMPSWKHGLGFFSGDPLGTDIQVTVQTPGFVGRRDIPGAPVTFGNPNALKLWAYEIRARAGQNSANLNYSKALVADVELGPLPANKPPSAN